MKIDLHAHSSWSDGDEAVDVVFETAAKAGVDVLALTDHDNTLGWAEAEVAAKRLGMGFVPGIEVTTRARRNVSRSFGVHMLAYLPDPENQALKKTLEESIENRIERLREIHGLVSKDFDLDWSDIEAQVSAGGSYGRPALAAALVARGHFEKVKHVFEIIWGPNEDRYYVPNRGVPEVFEAIELIRNAGGVPIIAHPMARGKGPAEGDPMPVAHFEEMIDAGLGGFEVFHRDVEDFHRNWLIDMATKHDLILTGSSDYHGIRKENVPGENTTSPEMLERIVAQATGTKVLL